MGKSSPAPPDYEGAARATGEASKEVTEQQTYANRPDQYTPWGTTTWDNENVWDPATQQNVNRWTSNTTLNPESQRALDAELALQADRSELGGSLYGRMETEFADPMNWKSLNPYGASLMGGDEARQAAEDAVYERSVSRLDPQWEQRESDNLAQLTAQGLRPGDAAYDRATDNMERDRTDAYQQAQYGAVMAGGQEASRQQGLDLQQSNYENQMRQMQMTEQMQQRGFSLNEINALISGQQVAMPSMSAGGTASKSGGVDYTGAALQGYEADVNSSNASNAQSQSMMQGAAAIAALAMSDRRLKKHITRIGSYRGYPWYLFQYLWGEWATSVMADEVNEEAVTRLDSGFNMVDLEAVR